MGDKKRRCSRSWLMILFLFSETKKFKMYGGGLVLTPFLVYNTSSCILKQIYFFSLGGRQKRARVAVFSPFLFCEINFFFVGVGLVVFFNAFVLILFGRTCADVAFDLNLVVNLDGGAVGPYVGFKET